MPALARQTEVKSVSVSRDGSTILFVVEDRTGSGPAHFRSKVMRFIDPKTSGLWNVSLPVAWLPVYKARFVPALDLSTASKGPILQRAVFVPGESGFVCYRALVLLSAGPTCIITASEGRSFYNPNTTHCGGATPKVLAVKTSTDGITFSPLQVAMSDDLSNRMTPHRLDLGSGVYDAASKMVHIHYGETTEPPGAKPHTSYKNAPHFVISGVVDEQTCSIAWQPPRDITASDRLSGTPSSYRWCGCCGAGFKLATGRLVVPGYFVQTNVESTVGHRKGQYNDSVQAAAFLSDDGAACSPACLAPHKFSCRAIKEPPTKLVLFVWSLFRWPIVAPGRFCASQRAAWRTRQGADLRGGDGCA